MPEPLAIESVNHVARLTRHLEESRKFYRDVLGFRELDRPNFKFPGAWLFNYGLQIHLIVDDNAPTEKGEISTRADHLALHVPDIDAAERLLVEHGIPYKRNYVADRDVTQIFFHDPDGHHVEIGCYPPVREAAESQRQAANMPR
ncbi:MAG: VOC family protein [Pirellulales bacterium]